MLVNKGGVYMSCKSDLKKSYELIVLGNDCPDTPRGYAWTEISVPETLTLPAYKADIGNIEKVIITSRITSKRVIATPDSYGNCNEEGNFNRFCCRYNCYGLWVLYIC